MGRSAKAIYARTLCAGSDARWRARVLQADMPDEPMVWVSLDSLGGSGVPPEGVCWVRLGEPLSPWWSPAVWLAHAVKLSSCAAAMGIGSIIPLGRCEHLTAWLARWLIAEPAPGSRLQAAQKLLRLVGPSKARRLEAEQSDCSGQLGALLHDAKSRTIAPRRDVPCQSRIFVDAARFFLAAGQYCGEEVHPLLWTQWYADHFLGEQGGSAVWHHFVTVGQDIGLPPNPYFYPRWWRGPQAGSTVQAPEGLNIIAFLQDAAADREPNPLFDVGWYRQNAIPSPAPGENSLLHFLAHGANQPTSAFLGRHPHIVPALRENLVTVPPTNVEETVFEPEALESQHEVRVAVCSVMTGNYDVLRPLPRREGNADYYLLSDRTQEPEAEDWQLIHVPCSGADALLHSRSLKLQIYRHIPSISDYGAVAYMDANVESFRIRGLLEAFMASGADLGLIAHPFRTCVFEEAAAVMLQGRDTVDNVMRTVSFLEAEGHPDMAGLYEMNLFCFRPGDVAAAFMDRWWALYQRYGRRDQLLVPLILHELNIKPFLLMSAGRSVRNHAHFRLHPHRSEHGL